MSGAEDRTTELLLRVEEVERERNYFESALRMIRGPYDFQGVEDFGPGKAYLDAGGGYEGLQAIASWALDEVDRRRGEADSVARAD